MKDALVLRYFCDPSVLLADHALSEQQHGNTDFCTEVTLEYFQSIKEKCFVSLVGLENCSREFEGQTRY